MPDLAERRQLLELRHRGDVLRERVVAVAEVREAVTEPATGVRDKMPHGRARRGVGVLELERGDVRADRRVDGSVQDALSSSV